MILKEGETCIVQSYWPALKGTIHEILNCYCLSNDGLQEHINRMKLNYPNGYISVIFKIKFKPKINNNVTKTDLLPF